MFTMEASSVIFCRSSLLLANTVVVCEAALVDDAPVQYQISQVCALCEQEGKLALNVETFGALFAYDKAQCNSN